MDFNPVLVWFLIGLGLILSEFLVPGVILVFFGLGAWLTAIATWAHMTSGFAAQILTFAGSSVVLLVMLRRWCCYRFLGNVADAEGMNLDLDALAGEKVVVTVAIPANGGGKVEYRGAIWDAQSETALGAGANATVVRSEGIVLIVCPDQKRKNLGVRKSS